VTRRRLGTGLLASAVLLLGACTPQINTAELEQQIQDELSSQTGVTPTSVDCPQDVPAEEGDTFRCTAVADDSSVATITVTQSDDEGNVRWEVTSVE
jgi:Domain of unknown function (DUF4333)